jgi:hypothetical protein
MTTSLLLAAAVTLAVAMSANGHAPDHRILTGAPPGLTTLYDQNGNDNGSYVDSENFYESDFDAYDSQAADEFIVASGHIWSVKEIDISGFYFYGSGPVTSVHLFFYSDQGGLPGAAKADCNNLGPSQADALGSFVVKIPKSCKVKLRRGTYWLSVQVNDSVARQWGWKGNSLQHGQPFAWRNPGDGFGTGCTTWRTDCFDVSFDLMFALKGKDAIR